MKKILVILIICFLAFGLLFGCTEESNAVNSNNVNNNGLDSQDPINNNTNTGTGTGGSTDSEIPMPPALPE